ncbi:L10-interacting MYB domain-containing protein-like [Lotus japonicus]|uniref:L10-interacting MYB domain-containing protein-like n=1 Tax=Lotus japonicus TaxID=34305 RepID=UPI002589F179|nr:L10-interacting MYB domain-containing protein-like [Lotus japonicus]
MAVTATMVVKAVAIPIEMAAAAVVVVVVTLVVAIDTMSNSESSRKNAKWEPDSTKVILDICMEEVRGRGKPGITFKSKKWEDIREKFERRTNKSYTQKQLKSKMYNLRTEFVTWKQLVGGETYFTMNNQTGTIEADAAWWDAKIRENAKYGKFRHEGPKFLNELESIFGETVETSQDELTPVRSVSIETSERNTSPDVSQRLTPVRSVSIETSERNTSLDVSQRITKSNDDDFNTEDGSNPMENTQLRRKRNAPQDINNKATKARGEVSTTPVVVENRDEAEKDETASYAHGQYSIPNCFQVVNNLKDGGHLDEQEFCYALEFIKDGRNRVILMSFKDGSAVSQKNWILYRYKL